mmetsp:Transcript_4418/g.6460  ORF Transcript_4418/g.6460 Transcript_4418/m.6460 type:complete len:189 (+) Transcript_4418:686-1252(+)
MGGKGEFDFNKHTLEEEEKKTEEVEETPTNPNQKPKYEKTNFFDELTNSTQEKRPDRRGGHRGGAGGADRGRGGFVQRGGSGGNRGGGRGGYYDRERGDGERQHQHYGSRGGYDNNYGGGGGRGGYRGGHRGGYNHRQSDGMEDPNARIYKKEGFAEGDEKTNSFFDRPRGRGGRGRGGPRRDQGRDE